MAANAGTDITAFVGEPVVLNGSASTDYRAYSQDDGTWSIRWQTGDGYEVENSIYATHVYQDAGTYTATLTVKNDAGSSSEDTVTVTINAIPAATGGNVQTLTDTGNTATNTTNLNSALTTSASNSAHNEIVLPAGMIVNEFTLPARSNAYGTYTTIRVANADTNLPVKIRATAADEANMFKVLVRSSNFNGIEFTSGAHRYRIIGMYAEASGSGAGDPPQMLTIDGDSAVTRIIIDRCVFDGNGTQRRGAIIANGEHTSVINSSLLDIKSTEVDSRAWATWEGSGPHAFINNYSVSSTYGFIVGGGGVWSESTGPRDIIIRGNHFWKDPTWNAGTYRVKNAFELKHVERIQVVGNIFENSQQIGGITEANHSAVWISGQGAGEHTRYLDLRLNKFINQNAYFLVSCVGGCLDITSEYVFIKHNLFEANSNSDTSNARNIIHNPRFLEMVHNTFVDRRSTGTQISLVLAGGSGVAGTSWTYRDNFVQAGEYGIYNNGGTATNELNEIAETWTFTGNTVYGTSGTDWPSGNEYNSGGHSSFTGNFTDYANSDYSLSSGSAYKNTATNSTDPGVDWTALQAETQFVEAGEWQVDSGGVLPTTPATSISGGLSMSGGVSITNG